MPSTSTWSVQLEMRPAAGLGRRPSCALMPVIPKVFAAPRKQTFPAKARSDDGERQGLTPLPSSKGSGHLPCPAWPAPTALPCPCTIQNSGNMGAVRHRGKNRRGTLLTRVHRLLIPAGILDPQLAAKQYRSAVAGDIIHSVAAPVAAIHLPLFRNSVVGGASAARDFFYVGVASEVVFRARWAPCELLAYANG
jgi:hypothetical protein